MLESLNRKLEEIRSNGHLNLSYLFFADSTFQELIAAIKDTRLIITIDNKDNSLTEAQLISIVSAITTPQSTISIRLAHTAITSVSLKYTLTAFKNLESIHFVKVEIPNLEALADFLSHSKSIKNLKLQECELDSVSFSHVAKAISKNQSLETLDCNRNKIGDEAIEDLAKALILNFSIKTLILSYNEITGSGAKVLFLNSFNSNYQLKEISLKKNNIGDEGATAIAEHISRKTCLIKINILENNVGDEGAEKLIEAVQKNKSITSLSVFGLYDGKKATTLIFKSVQQNIDFAYDVARMIIEDGSMRRITKEQAIILNEWGSNAVCDSLIISFDQEEGAAKRIARNLLDHTSRMV